MHDSIEAVFREYLLLLEEYFRLLHELGQKMETAKKVEDVWGEISEMLDQASRYRNQIGGAERILGLKPEEINLNRETAKDKIDSEGKV
jgi:hypothetical protein